MKRPRLLAAGVTAVVIAGLATANTDRARKAKRDNPPLGRFTEVDGVKLHYLERGSGQPILLVHGNGLMLQDWIISGLFDELAKTNRVIAVDRPGFGYSGRPRLRGWTPERQADLLAAFMEQLGIEQAAVVGHSYGTQLAVALALNHPELVKSVALIGGYYYPTPRADVLMVSGSALPVYGDIVNHLAMPLMAQALRRPVSRKIFQPAEPTARWLKDFSFGLASRPSRARAGAADAVHMIPAARRLAKRYREIAQPVAIVAGRGDRIVNPKTHSERLHQDLPHSRLVLLDGAGHMAHHTAMREVAATIRML